MPKRSNPSSSNDAVEKLMRQFTKSRREQAKTNKILTDAIEALTGAMTSIKKDLPKHSTSSAAVAGR